MDVRLPGANGGPITSYGKTVTATYNPSFTVTSPDSSSFPYYGVTSDDNTSVAGTSTPISVAIPASGSPTPYAYAGKVGQPAITVTYTLTPDELAGVTGSGSTEYSFLVEAEGSITGANLPYAPAFNMDSLVGNTSIAYTYAAVPEPASLGTLGLGVLALVVRRRK